MWIKVWHYWISNQLWWVHVHLQFLTRLIACQGASFIKDLSRVPKSFSFCLLELSEVWRFFFTIFYQAAQSWQIISLREQWLINLQHRREAAESSTFYSFKSICLCLRRHTDKKQSMAGLHENMRPWLHFGSVIIHTSHEMDLLKDL